MISTKNFQISIKNIRLPKCVKLVPKVWNLFKKIPDQYQIFSKMCHIRINKQQIDTKSSKLKIIEKDWYFGYDSKVFDSMKLYNFFLVKSKKILWQLC